MIYHHNQFLPTENLVDRTYPGFAYSERSEALVEAVGEDDGLEDLVFGC